MVSFRNAGKDAALTAYRHTRDFSSTDTGCLIQNWVADYREEKTKKIDECLKIDECVSTFTPADEVVGDSFWGVQESLIGRPDFFAQENSTEQEERLELEDPRPSTGILQPMGISDPAVK
ncbi:hypothetical protein MMC22_005777 [Lobaria immixta]|nr:hypothetical protein [Lobaria immixta]